jgi:carboxyl-terminal processing protease
MPPGSGSGRVLPGIMRARCAQWLIRMSTMRHRVHTITFVALAFGATAAVRDGTCQTLAITPGVAKATFDTVWARVNNTFYDTAFLAHRWVALGDSLRPLAYAAKTNDELRRVVQTLLSGVGVSHFGLIPEEVAPALGSATANAVGGQGSAGGSVRLAGDSLVVTHVDSGGSLWSAGVRAGAIVTRVQGLDVPAAVAQLARVENAELRRQARITVERRVNGDFTGTIGDMLRLELRDAGTSRAIAVAYGAGRGQVSRVGNLPPLQATIDVGEHRVPSANGVRRIGVVAFSVWLPVLAPQLDSAFDRLRGSDGIVIDLRGNPGGFAAMINGVAGHLLDSAYTLGTLRQRVATLQLRTNPQRVSPDKQPVRPFAGPVAILVDPLSASASEFFAAALQALGRARIFGDTSAGASVPAVLVRLPNGDVMMHAVADHTDPAGRRIEGRGVIPDVVVPLRIEALRVGRDETLEAALAWLAQPGR